MCDAVFDLLSSFLLETKSKCVRLNYHFQDLLFVIQSFSLHIIEFSFSISSFTFYRNINLNISKACSLFLCILFSAIFWSVSWILFCFVLLCFFYNYMTYNLAYFLLMFLRLSGFFAAAFRYLILHNTAPNYSMNNILIIV